MLIVRTHNLSACNSVVLKMCALKYISRVDNKPGVYFSLKSDVVVSDKLIIYWT